LLSEAEELRARHVGDATRAAITKFKAATDVAVRRGDRQTAVRASLGLGAAYQQLGLLRPSLESYQAALVLGKGLADAGAESEIRSAIGIAQALVTDREEGFQQARQQCERARELARASGSVRAEARSLNCLGEVAYYAQRPEEALAHYSDAAVLWDRLGDARGRAETLLYQGYVHSDLSHFADARACYAAARPIWSSLHDDRQQAITLVAEARLQLRLAEYEQALEKFHAAIALLEPMNDAVWEGAALTGLARAYLDMAETRAALSYWERALRDFEVAGLNFVAVDVLMSLGATYLASGDDENALRRFERALARADELGIDRWRAIAERQIGVVQLFRGQPTDALRHLERAFESQARVHDARLEGEVRTDLGEARLLLDQAPVAHREFATALRLSRGASDRVTQTRALFGMARLSAARGDLAAARAHVEGALALAESLRTATENRDLQASYLASVYGFYELYVDVLFRLHRRTPLLDLSSVAFEVNERARARSLLDGLADAGVDLRGGLDPTLGKRELLLRRAFDDWRERQRLAGAAEGGPAARRLAEEYQELETRYAQLQAEIRSRSPRYAALAHPRPLTLAEVQRQVVDDESLLLEFSLGEERSYVWAVSKGQHFSHELPPRDQIERAVRETYDGLTTRLRGSGSLSEQRSRAEAEDALYGPRAARLSNMLLGSVASQVARAKRILLVADGMLQYLPFGALPEPRREKNLTPLVVEHQIVMLPSASVLAAIRSEARNRAAPTKAIAVLADPVFERDDPRLTPIGRERGTPETGGEVFPRLLATRREADAVLALAPAGSTLRALGFSASRATATSPVLGQYRIIHFASHSVFDDQNAGASGIVLSLFDETGRAQDGFLRLHDLYRLQLPVELVVLSACDTANGRLVRGEGLVGVVRGFMYAGAQRVVASLWRVDDDATSELMRIFYREMLERRRTPAAALRQAQLAIRAQPRWSAPFFWAAFVLQGEPQ
jgi:CHAT domain-containing protein/tetratricopeptide (TPR) repeat protein